MRTLPRTDEKGAFRIGDLIVLDISVAVAAEISAERRVQGNEKLPTKEVK